MLSDIFTNNRKTKLYWMSVALVVIFLTAMAISPVRAIILSYPLEIAGRLFEISDDYPGDKDVEIIEPQIMSLDEALAVFPYTVELPSNVPPEYVLVEDDVWVYLDSELPDTLIVSWRGEGKGLSLSICGDCEWERGEIVASDAVEEVLLDNQYPAVLIRGGWYENERTWNYGIALTLEWQVGNMLYNLSAGGTGTMTPEQLAEIATSTFEQGQ